MRRDWRCQCIICGKWFEAKAKHATACSEECKKRRKYLIDKNRRTKEAQIRAEQRKLQREEAKKAELQAELEMLEKSRKKSRVPGKDFLTIGQISVLAAKEGLSYGYYLVKHGLL